jgi:hypothetical protein
MQVYTTTSCHKFGHPEVTVQLAKPSPVPNLHRMLTSYFEGAVARGSKFLPGQIVRVGWASLRLCERADGTIGVEEREIAPEVAWTESVDRALMDTWCQKEIAASVGLDGKIAFPAQDEAIMVSPCAQTAKRLLLTRLDGDLPDGFSGWSLACSEDHDHGEPRLVPLLALAATSPALVQLLALPPGTSVFVRFVDKKGAPAGSGRVEPHIVRDGKELPPKPGSYLAGLQGP